MRHVSNRYRASWAYGLVIWLPTIGTDGWQAPTISQALVQRYANFVERFGFCAGRMSRSAPCSRDVATIVRLAGATLRSPTPGESGM